MKNFELPTIEVITFTTEQIMDSTVPSVGDNQMPWA